MKSFGFPRMFNQTGANLLQDKEAIRSNMLLLLSSERETLFGDPYFGCQLKKYLFEQETSIVVDLLIDHIYTTITTFMPQVFVKRKDIVIHTVRTAIFADVKYYYTIDNSSDLFTIQLTQSIDED